MTATRATKIAIMLVLTVLSGVGDTQGFVHAARIWSSGQFVLAELAKSALGFGAGMGLYWLLMRFAGSAGIVSPEVQVLGWFAVTLTSVAVIATRSSRGPRQTACWR